MQEKISKWVKNLPNTIFWTLVNPASVMGLGFLFISGTVRLEQLAEYTRIEILSLDGFFSTELAIQFSSWYHAVLNDHNLIPPIFFTGMCVLFIQKYRQLKNSPLGRKRAVKAMTLVSIESVFIAVILFGGAIGNIQALFPDAVTNFGYFLGMVLPGFFFRICKSKIAEHIDKYIELHKIK